MQNAKTQTVTLIRLGPKIWARDGGLIPIGKTKFSQELLGKRVRCVRLGTRSVAAVKEDIERVVAELVEEAEPVERAATATRGKRAKAAPTACRATPNE